VLSYGRKCAKILLLAIYGVVMIMKKNTEKRIKPISLSVELKGSYAQKLIRDVKKNPTASSMKKNVAASSLLEELRR
jgi:hypothetical protein